MFRITGTGMHIPGNLVTNEQLFEKYGRENLEKVFARIGHGARYYCDKEETSADLAVKAGREALLASGASTADIDLLIISTDTPAHLSPATASEVQHRLELSNAAAFDVNCACAGFVTALDIAGKFLDGAQYKKALVVGTYAMSKFLNPEDGVSTPLFGDGAGAFVLEAGGEGRFSSVLKADGQYWDYMGIYDGRTVSIPKKYPPTLNKDHWPPLVEKTLSRIGMRPADVDLFVFTQIRKATIEEVMQEFGLPVSRTHTIMEKWGYTGSACIPMAFHDAVGAGRIKRGERVVLCASGGGFAMACMSFVY